MEVTNISNVTRTFTIGKVETRALRGVNLKIESGEFTALVGPSGSGKTTLLQIIGCLDQPTTGSVIINGQDVTKLNRNQRADLRKGTLGFVFQFFALIPTLNAYENVELPLLLSGGKNGTRKERVMELLNAVGLADRAHHRPDQLSGGEQQRVAVARAAIMRPALILADEPTGNLDLATGAKVFDLLLDLNREKKMTLMVVTHSEALASRMGRTLRMADGRLVGDGDGS